MSELWLKYEANYETDYQYLFEKFLLPVIKDKYLKLYISINKGYVNLNWGSNDAVDLLNKSGLVAVDEKENNEYNTIGYITFTVKIKRKGDFWSPIGIVESSVKFEISKNF